MMFELDDEDQLIYEDLLGNGTSNERYVANYYKYELDENTRKKVNEVYSFTSKKFRMLDFGNILNLIEVLGSDLHSLVFSPYIDKTEEYFKLVLRQFDSMIKSIYHINVSNDRLGGTNYRYNYDFENFLNVFDLTLKDNDIEINELRRLFVDYLGTFVNNNSMKDFSNGKKRARQYYLIIPKEDSKYKRDKSNYTTFTKFINGNLYEFVDNNNEAKIILTVVSFAKEYSKFKINANVLRFILNRYDDLKNSGYSNDDAKNIVIDEIYNGKLINFALAYDIRQKYSNLRNSDNLDLRLNID